MSALAPTPGQTVGPFFGYALPFEGDGSLVPRSHPEAIRLRGNVIDGHGVGVPDALLELWQADPDGAVVQRPGSLRRDGWTFTGWGRASTDLTGAYTFTTLRPGPTDPGRPAFFAVTVLARGLLDRLFTRAYLPDDPAALERDPFLGSLGERRSTLICRTEDEGYAFDVRLQGQAETVFLRFSAGTDGRSAS